jgi:hypothetical protein
VSKGIIYSILLHTILVLYLALSFSFSKSSRENSKINVKVKLQNSSLAIKSEKAPQKIIDNEIKDSDIKKEAYTKSNTINKTKKPKKEKNIKKNKITNKNSQKTKTLAKEELGPFMPDKIMQQKERIAQLKKKNTQKEFQMSQKSISGLNLSNREKFNLYSQIKSCFKRSLLESEKTSKENILVRINIDRYGYITSDIDDLEEMIDYKSNKEEFAIAVKNAKRAIDLCSPLRGLPIDKYNIWKEIIIEFSQEGIDKKN